MRTSEHDSDLGRWRAVWRDTAAPLASFVTAYFGSESVLPEALRERHLPSFGVSLVINFAAPHRFLGQDGADAHCGRRAWIVGVQDAWRLAEAVGERAFLIAQLTPLGAHHILRERMDLISGRIVDLDAIDPLFARSLLGRVDAATGWEARIEALEAALIERLSVRAVEPSLASAALEGLRSGGGDIGGLARALGRSHRHLIAAFRDEIGLTPKGVARLLRFERAIEAINRARESDYPSGKPYLDGPTDAAGRSRAPQQWSDLALACGFYDQSHFINEFRAFSGETPESFRRRLAEAAA
jgi:AraC-like DNA-binding protein